MKFLPAFLLFFFISQIALADYITQNTANGCYDDTIYIDNDVANLSAIFTPNSHTCSVGYFLPANIDECRACGVEHTCPGGTYSFNENVSQGITWSIPFKQSSQNSCMIGLLDVDNNNNSVLYAMFTPNEHTCSSGYYLPANIDECTICPANSACIGGTYSFNETTDQGIQSCANGTFSPTGSAVCYPHILHVGNDNVYLRSTKQTTPSLNIQIGNDIFYANMTTVPTYMNKDSSHYLHILYEGDDYYVCDDTTYQE